MKTEKEVKMKAQLIGALINALLSILTPDLVKKFADMVLDFAENAVLGSETKVDDMLVLPLCNMIRNAFDIPDED